MYTYIPSFFGFPSPKLIYFYKMLNVVLKHTWENHALTLSKQF